MKHAILSPSNAEKWSNCPASIQLEAQAVAESPPHSNVHADTGTVAHMMAEVCLTYGKDPLIQFAQMQENVMKYIQYVKDLQTPWSHHLIEEKIEIFEDCWGTADLVLRDRDELHIIDLKYGKGLVKAEDNKQMLLYAYGMIQKMENIANITLHIVMPRGKNSLWTLSRTDLLIRGAALEIQGAKALDPDILTTNPSDKTCQWCKALWICPAQLDKRTKDFDDLSLD